MENTSHSITVKLFLDALLKGDHKQCSYIASQHIETINDIQPFYENVIKPALYKVGEMWEYNFISVAAEHLATSITEAVMNELYAKIISTNRNGKKVVVGCVENEFHQVGIKMVADVFEMKGWDTLFLGANIPNKELLDFVLKEKPSLVALSLTVYFHLPELEAMLTLFRNELPDMPIIVGGQAFLHGGAEVVSKHTNVIFLPNLEAINRFIDSL